MTVARKWTAPDSEFLVPFDGSFRIADAPTAPPGEVDKVALKEERRERTRVIRDLQRKLPERARIGVFNRSHYEEVLVVRVDPEFLESQRLPYCDPYTIWNERFESIRNFESHLADSGTIIVKFFLNVSLDRQKHRFIRRIDKPSKNWKFNPGDVKERERWGDYMSAFEDALEGLGVDSPKVYEETFREVAECRTALEAQ